MKEISIGGILLAPISIDLVLALGIYYLLRFFFGAKLDQRVWHPPLVHLCIYLIILSTLALLE